MGTYFNNTELDALWVRLVNATEEITDSSLSNTGIKGIHDALISYTGLAHSTTPSTPGDYMKGIAVCSRYITNSIIDITTENSLTEIVAMLENPGSINPPTDSQVTTSITLTQLTDDFQFTVTHTYTDPDDCYIEGYHVVLWDDTVDSIIVAEKQFSGGSASSTSLTFTASDIYDEFNYEGIYQIEVHTLKSSGEWSVGYESFSWPFMSSGGGGETSYPTPMIYLAPGGRIYVENYHTGTHSCEIYITHYGAYYAVRYDTLEDGYTQEQYSYGPEFGAQLRVEYMDGDIPAYTDYSNLIELA